MFEFFLRKTILRGMSKDEFEEVMLLKYKIKMQLLSYFLICIFGVSPLASFTALLVLGEHTLSIIVQGIIMILSYCIFAIWFVIRFRKPIIAFHHLITANLYTTRYVLKGNALSREDFETIQKENKALYNIIMIQKSKGYCYSVCFEMLKCVKKGTILFVAVKPLKQEKEENGNMEYTMHVLYVNNDWCFDTYSQRQFPLEEVLKSMKAKIFTSFDYDAVKGKTLEEFKAEHIEALKTWCQENDCYHEWQKKE